MKSLEIVNSCLYIIDYTRRQMSEEELLMNIDGYFVKENELETIKQDLEVLEILKQHLEIIEYLGMKNIETSGLNTTKNIKDFNKLKQWLEENENV